WNSEFLKVAKKNKILINTDLGLFFEAIKDRGIKVVGITGTRGKTTTTYLIFNILKSKYKSKVFMGGNIGNSPLNFVDKLKKGDIVVLEVSSFQLHDLKNHHFDVGVITNVLPDHLNFYNNLDEYQKDKENILSNQTKDDFFVLNKLDPKVKRMAKKTKAKKLFFTKSKIKGLKIIGEHNYANIDAALKVARIFNINDREALRVIKGFKGVPDRLEFIREYKGRKFYNDTTATSPDAAIVALKSFKQKVILISGGNSKKLELKKLNREIKKKVKHLILLPGEANKELPEGLPVKDMEHAVQAAWALSEKGDVFLLSPGLTWLPLMNEFKRGEEFIKFVKKIK
ncbi:MAG: UDP-N-acetylmuramoyl-L-alanine--D-glutamate ligase, partial [Patescibacteria group bacterium]